MSTAVHYLTVVRVPDQELVSMLVKRVYTIQVLVSCLKDSTRPMYVFVEQVQWTEDVILSVASK